MKLLYIFCLILLAFYANFCKNAFMLQYLENRLNKTRSILKVEIEVSFINKQLKKKTNDIKSWLSDYKKSKTKSKCYLYNTPPKTLFKIF